MKIILPIVVILCILAYVGRHLWLLVPGPLLVRNLCVCAFVAPLLLLIASFAWNEQLPLPFVKVFYIIGTAWFFVFLYAVMAFLLMDVAGWLVPRFRPLLRHNMTVLLSLGAVLLLVFTYGNIHYHHKKRVELDLAVQKPLPRPLKIVAVSDLHLGYTIGPRELQRWVRLINAEEPDLILIAGDAIDSSVRPLLADSAYRSLSGLRAKLGVYACLGNHDVMAHTKASTDFLEACGVNVLRDDVTLVDSMVYIIGRQDKSAPNRKSLTDIMKGLDRSKPTILLDHQPYGLEEAEQNGIDLQLSGHTHRGQVFPINLITDGIYEISHGYLRKGATHIYVSSGLGIWGGKFRIGSQSEYAVIELHS